MCHNFVFVGRREGEDTVTGKSRKLITHARPGKRFPQDRIIKSPLAENQQNDVNKHSDYKTHTHTHTGSGSRHTRTSLSVLPEPSLL